MDSIEKLTQIFKKFPTVGQRTAGRFVYYLLKLPKERIAELAQALTELSTNVKLCSLCFNPFEDEGTLCHICKNTNRNKSLLCVVEKEADLASLETARSYRGLYFILGGLISPLQKDEVSVYRLPFLIKRVSDPALQEIILALNPTGEGKATSMLIEEEIKRLGRNIRITHLARGIPAGAELEYADEETLASALEGRK
jgi:recombination protein RecR